MRFNEKAKNSTKNEMHHKSTTSTMQDHLEMLSDHAAEKAATVSVCHPMNPSQHPSIKDELETDLNRNNSNSSACQAEQSAPWEQRPDMKSNGHDHQLMKSYRFWRTMKTVWATYKYPVHSIKRVVFARSEGWTWLTFPAVCEPGAKGSRDNDFCRQWLTFHQFFQTS